MPGEVFVLGVARSGSTLLRLILDTHDAIACPGELSLGRLAEQLFHAAYYSLGQLSRDGEEARVAAAIAFVRSTIARLMQEYAAVKGKRVWAEKTPDNVTYAPRLAQVFPDARFVCLYRHPADHIRSGIESARFGKLNADLWDHDRGCEHYVQQTRKLLDFEAANREKCFRLAYEDLVSHPEQVLPEMFRFIGVDWDPGLIARVFTTPHDDGPGDPKALLAARIYQTSMGRGREALPILASIAARLQNEIAQLTIELGYRAIDTPASHVEPRPRAAGSMPPPASVAELFESYFPAKLRSGTQLTGSIEFRVKGAGGGNWTLDLNAAPPVIRPGSGQADCTITIRADDVLKLVAGEVDAGECYLNARLKVSGDEAMALSLGRLLFAPS